MLVDEIRNIDNLPGALRDLDLTSTGNWIGVTEFGAEQILIFGGARVADSYKSEIMRFRS